MASSSISSATNPSDQTPQFPRPRLPSISDLSTHSIGADTNATAALGKLQALQPETRAGEGQRERQQELDLDLDPDLDSERSIMGLDPVPQGHRRRVEDPKLELSDGDSSDDLELEDLSDEGLQDDEETGLTGKDKKRRKKRRRRNTLLDHRVAEGTGKAVISAEEKKEADQNVYNKWMFDPQHLDFHFPLFTTCFHMLVQFSQPLMTRMFYLTRIGPCGMATGLDIGLGNMSLKFITLTFYSSFSQSLSSPTPRMLTISPDYPCITRLTLMHQTAMCKSSSLAFVLLFAFLFHLEVPSLRLVLIIITMTLGVIMMVFGEVSFSPLGFMLGFHVLIDKKGVLLGPLLLLFPGCIAFLMTASEFALLQRTSVVTLSIAGIFKEVVTISAAGLVFHDPLTPINISGLFVTIGAIAAYNWIKICKMRDDAQKEAHAKRHRGDDGSGFGSESDGEDGSGSQGEDWNRQSGTYITSDGDILPMPSASSTRKAKHGHPTKEEIAKLIAGKRELSE
ncbi:triose-phosphate transporter [Diplocarpon rosae]|nr:triose-phosphate transporter [Diplocarpon rosae]